MQIGSLAIVMMRKSNSSFNKLDHPWKISQMDLVLSFAKRLLRLIVIKFMIISSIISIEPDENIENYSRKLDIKWLNKQLLLWSMEIMHLLLICLLFNQCIRHIHNVFRRNIKTPKILKTLFECMSWILVPRD